MKTSFETVESAALNLSITERVKLSEHLIASLDEDSEIEAAWADEVDRRIAEVEAGTVHMIPAAEAIASALHAQLK